MRIPNKFNGYSRDGIRLYNDPATATITIASMGEGAAIASSLGAAGLLGTVGTSMVGAGALAEGMALGNGLYTGGGIGSLTTPTTAAATAPTGVASNFNAPSYLSNLQTPVTSPTPVFTPDQMAMNTNIAQSPMLNPTLNPTAQITPTVNAAPEMLNATKVYEAARPVYPQGVESLAQGRGFPAVESITAPPVAAPTVPTNIASGYTANPYVTQAPVASAPPVTAPTATAPTVVETPAVQPQVESPLVNNATPADYRLATANPTSAAPNVVTEGGKTAVKPGMTGNAYDDAKTLFSKPNWENIKGFASEHPYMTAAAGLGAYQLLKPKAPEEKKTPSHIRPYTNTRMVSPTASYYTPYSGASTAERNYFTGGLQALPIYEAAEGGITSLAVGGPIETMSAMNAVGENLGYPQSQYQTDIYSNPNVQRPEAMNMIAPSGDVSVDQYTGEQKFGVGGLSGNAGTELSKMMGTGSKDTGEYKYSYDPKTQQFTQLSDPVYEATQQAAQTPQWNSIGQRFQQQAVNPNSWYGAQTAPKVAPKPFVPIVTGGLAQPAIQPEAQAPVQQAAPMQIPAYQTPEQQLGLNGFYDYMNQQLGGMRGHQGFAEGGLSHLGGYSDGGRLLRGPGDGVSDSIPASIGDRQPARLADGEFVVPARIVSEIGNGSTEAGARKLYAMMERVQSARKKSVGKDKVAVNSKADKYLPA